VRRLALAAVLLGATAAAATGATGTRRVAARLTLADYPLVCGHARAPVAVSFPLAVHVPRVIAPAAVRLNSSPAGAVAVAAHSVKVNPAAPSGIQCQSIVLGPLTIAFTPAAGISTAAAPRAYRVVVRVGTKPERAVLKLSA
jgi:hypothetical protein